MPIYEYECGKCGAHLEVLQKVGDKPLSRCSKCSGKVRKVVSRSSFQLKGSGWYVTDYAKSGSGGASKPEAKTESTAPASSPTVSGSGD
jgi:putative FmdB family regulatory protein